MCTCDSGWSGDSCGESRDAGSGTDDGVLGTTYITIVCLLAAGVILIGGYYGRRYMTHRAMLHSLGDNVLQVTHTRTRARAKRNPVSSSSSSS